MSSDHDYTKTDINGLPARYVLTKDPNDPTGTASIVVKVIDTDAFRNQNPRPPILNPLYNFNETPLHLQDHTKLITQHRLGDHSLPHRVINPEHYTKEEMEWYIKGEIPASPMSICMTYAKKCYLCGDFQENQEDMRFESAGQHPFGYKFCKDCEPYFRRDMHDRLQLSCIWELRLAYEKWCQDVTSTYYTNNSVEKPAGQFIWVNRTRRDENGARDMASKRPYKYTKWRIINWVPKKFQMVHYDETTKEVVQSEEYGLVVEQIDTEEQIQIQNQNVVGGEYMTLTKIVPLYDILAINFDIGTPGTPNRLKNLNTYDPNIDDPLNKYTYEDKHGGLRPPTGVNPCKTPPTE